MAVETDPVDAQQILWRLIDAMPGVDIDLVNVKRGFGPVTVPVDNVPIPGDKNVDNDGPSRS